MKLSLIARSFCISIVAVLLPKEARAGTYDTSDLFHIQIFGGYLGILSNTVSSLIGLITMVEFGLCFGPYTAIAPGTTVTLSRRQRQLLEELANATAAAQSLNMNEYMMNASSAIDVEGSAATYAQNKTVREHLQVLSHETTQAAEQRHLSTVRTCPSDCSGANRKKCAYNNCATKGNRRRTLRSLRGGSDAAAAMARELALFNVDLGVCEAAIELKLKIAFRLLRLECVIDVNP